MQSTRTILVMSAILHPKPLLQRDGHSITAPAGLSTLAGRALDANSENTAIVGTDGMSGGSVGRVARHTPPFLTLVVVQMLH